MSIFRVKKTSNYVVVHKASLNDNRLSWKAKGLLAYMLSMPDDWTFYDTELEKHAKDGKDSLKSAIKELKQYGYMKRERRRNQEGKFDWETSVFETPCTEKPLVDNPSMEKPCMEKPSMENPQLLSNDELSIEELNNDKPNINIPYVEIVTYLNDAAKTSYRSTTKKTKDLIKARWNEGFRLADFKKVIDIKTSQWLNDNKMNSYIRPETLFGTKFESYLNEKPKKERFDLSEPSIYDKAF